MDFLTALLVAQNIQPLRPGIYNAGSGYIEIARKGNRFCYRGSSSNGVTVASISPTANGYNVDKFDITLQQIDSRTLAFGGRDYTLVETPANATGVLANCLNSKGTFFQQQLFRR